MKGKIIFAFIAGAAAGTAVSWFILKTKYEQIIEEESASIRETLSRRLEELGDKVEPCRIYDEQGEPVDDLSVDEQTRYGMLTRPYTSEEETDSKEEGGGDVKKPYVIHPDDCDKENGYEIFDMSYYEDGYLVYDIDGEVVTDIEETVGYDAFKHFGEYEENTVYVRNDEMRMDFIITCDARNYLDIIDGVLDSPQQDD